MPNLITEGVYKQTKSDNVICEGPLNMNSKVIYHSNRARLPNAKAIAHGAEATARGSQNIRTWRLEQP